jgi:hypothetical protein
MRNEIINFDDIEHDCRSCVYKATCRHLSTNPIINSLNFHNPYGIIAKDDELFHIVTESRALADDEVEVIAHLDPDSRRFRKIIKLDVDTAIKAKNMILSFASEGFQYILVCARDKKENSKGVTMRTRKEGGEDAIKNVLRELIVTLTGQEATMNE